MPTRWKCSYHHGCNGGLGDIIVATLSPNYNFVNRELPLGKSATLHSGQPYGLLMPPRGVCDCSLLSLLLTAVLLHRIQPQIFSESPEDALSWPSSEPLTSPHPEYNVTTLSEQCRPQTLHCNLIQGRRYCVCVSPP